MNSKSRWIVAAAVSLVVALSGPSAPVHGQVGFCVEAANGNAGDRGEARVTLLVHIHAGGRADGALGSLFQSGSQSVLGPLLLRL